MKKSRLSARIFALCAAASVMSLTVSASAPKNAPKSAEAPISNIDELVQRLGAIDRYDASAAYSVLLPTATDDVTYTIDLQSLSARDDRFSPCEYLIEWTLPTPSGVAEGFSTYYHGSHFRYRNERLQEYHYDWDSIPFLTADGGVQRNAQFTGLLPQFIAADIQRYAASPNFTMELTTGQRFDGREAVRLDVEESVQGYTARRMAYTFDASDALPLRFEMESNPGEISEQSVHVTYGAPAGKPVGRFCEDTLVERFPTIFEKYRQSNFHAENLPGTRLPGFALPTVTGERYSRARDESFHSPVVVALIDPDVATAKETVGMLRSSLDMLPMTVGIVWVFMSTNIDRIEEIVGSEAVMGETTLMNGRSLARDCGVTSFPTLIFVDRDGMVAGVQLGYNKNLPEIVMQKTAMLK